MFNFNIREWLKVGGIVGIVKAFLTFVFVNAFANQFLSTIPESVAVSFKSIFGNVIWVILLIVVLIEVLYVVIGRSVFEISELDKRKFWGGSWIRLTSIFFVGKFLFVFLVLLLMGAIDLFIAILPIFLVSVFVSSVVSASIAYLVYKFILKEVVPV